MKTLSDAMRKLLCEQYSTKRFYIEYGGFLSNHIAHGIIALSKLGAPLDRIEFFAQKYAEKLEPAQPYMDHEKDLPVISSFDLSLVGKRQRFYGLQEFYSREVEKLGADGAISKFLPQLIDGLSGSAFHGLIQLGYGYSFEQNPQLVSEGLAYLHHSHKALARPLGEVPSGLQVAKDFNAFATSLTNVLALVKAENKLPTVLEQELASQGTMNTSGFQSKIHGVSKHIDMLDGYSKMLLLPKETEWFIDSLLQIYTLTCTDSKSDFFILHGVTSAWALAQISHLVDKEQAHYSFANALIAVFVVQGCPPLSFTVKPNDELPDWQTIIANGTLKEKDQDEHVYKLIQVSHERSQSRSGNLDENVYKQAAMNVQSLGFQY